MDTSIVQKKPIRDALDAALKTMTFDEAVASVAASTGQTVESVQAVIDGEAVTA